MRVRTTGKKADMPLFKDYLYYFLEIPADHVGNLTEEGFNILKNYFFKEKEGYDLDASYSEFMNYLKNN